MMKGKALESNEVVNFNWKHIDSLLDQSRRNQLLERLIQRKLSDAGLNNNLPQSSNTHQDIVVGINDDVSCMLGEPIIICKEPQE